MSFSTTSYFAGVATAFAAVTLGFSGGFFISNPTQKADPPNRIERVAANAPLPNPSGGPAVAPVPQAAPATPAPLAAASESAPAPQPVAQQSPPAQDQSAQQAATAQAPVQQAAATQAPVVAKDDAAELNKIREADLRAAERKRAQHRRWAERQRHQQELDAATAQVRQIDRGDGEQVVQRGPMEMPRFGFFGNDD